jgi:hypothetical protein
MSTLKKPSNFYNDFIAFAKVNDKLIPTISEQSEIVLTAISTYAHAFNVKVRKFHS